MINGATIFTDYEIEFLIDENKDLIQKIKQNETTKELIDSIKNIDCYKIKMYVDEINDNCKYKTVVFCGIGGSSLGIRSFVFPRIIDQSLEKKCFFLENIDPVSILSTFKNIVLSETLFVFISKSGGTIETLSQSEFIVNLLKNNNIRPEKHCISITSIDKLNDLSNLSNDNNIKIYPWCGNVGGRFSALTISTLLPLALIGFNIENIAKAGKDLDMSSGLKGAVINYLLWQKNYDVNVMMVYSDQLINFASWYRQLWAESIGKDGFGSLPDIATGTIDQHSMLQMYLGGKKNKFFTLIKIDSDGTEFANNESQKLDINMQYSSLLDKNSNVNFAKMLKNACEATAKSMIEEKCPVRIITIPAVNEYYIAKMMIDFFFETIFITELVNKYLNYSINPFGQPNVEKSKQNLLNSIKNSL